MNINDSLQQQIEEILNNKSWTAPKEVSADKLKNHTNHGIAPDIVKALFSLMKQKEAVLVEKIELRKKLNPVKTEKDTLIPFGFLGGGMGLGFGGIFEHIIMQTQTKSISLPELLSEDPVAMQELEAEIALLMAERGVVEAMLHYEIKKITNMQYPYAQKCNAVFTPDFSLFIELVAESEDWKLKTEQFNLQVERLKEQLHFITLPQDSPHIEEFDTMMAELQENNILCFAGVIPHFNGKDTKAYYLPKSLDEFRMYEDVKVEEKDETALARKERVRELFQTMISLGTPYVFKEEEKEAEA